MLLEFKPDADAAKRSTALGIPIKFACEPGKVGDTLPAQGEHTRQVLLEAGYTDTQIAALTEVST